MDNNVVFNKNLTVKSALSTIAKRWYIFIFLLIAFVIFGTVYSAFFVKPEYTSSARLYVVDNKNAAISSSDLVAYSYLALDIEVLISDDVVLNEVVADVNGKYTANQLRNFISVKNIDGTRIIEVSSTTSDANDSHRITKSVCNIVQNKVVDIVGADRISFVSQTDEKGSSVFTSKSVGVMHFLIIGAFVDVILFVILLLSDNKISSEEDIKNILDLSVLAVIPYNSDKKSR